MLKYMYITNDPTTAKIVEAAGVERVFVDMEYVGKAERQGGMDSVQNTHSLEDVARIRAALTHAELLVRINQIYDGTSAEIEGVIRAGADAIMLPYFKTAAQVSTFLHLVNGRARTILLFETPESVAHADEILALPGIDECYIGLNDLHLGYRQRFLFEPVADGTVAALCRKFKQAGLPFGFGGVARLGTGSIPAEQVLAEHIRLGSTRLILSRTFCNADLISDYSQIEQIFTQGIAELRRAEQEMLQWSDAALLQSFTRLQQSVAQLVSNMQ